MFIPDFWCGVIVTVLAEVGTLVLAAVLPMLKKKFKKK
jgi:hypothetical protein